MPKNQASVPAASAAHSCPQKLEGAPRGEYESLSATLRDVRHSLRVVGERSPELARVAAIADAMLVTLDTIRDECACTAMLGRDAADRGDFARARARFDRIVTMTGRFGDAHELHIRPRSPGSESIERIEASPKTLGGVQ